MRVVPLRLVSRAMIITIFVCGSVFFLLPLWQTMVGGFSTLNQVVSGQFYLLPEPWQWNLPRVLQIVKSPSLQVMVVNSVKMAVTAIPVVFCSALAAFGLARFHGAGRDLVFYAIMSTLMLPFTVTMIPRFIMFRSLNWTNTYLPFYATSICGAPMAIFLLRQFMRNVPRELDDAAKVDGAGALRIFFAIMVPICKPALATVSIFAIVNAWNDFMGPLIFLNTNDKFPIPLGILTIQTSGASQVTEWNCIMFVVLMATFPMLAIFFLFQKYIVKGVVMSGLKG